MRFLYKADLSFGAKGKKPVKHEYVACTVKEINSARLKKGISVTLVNLTNGLKPHGKE